MGILPQELPWYVVGPLIGCVVAGMYAVTNQPIGASGSYAQLTDRILGKVMKEPWRLLFMTGVIVGGIVAAWLIQGRFSFSASYGLLGTRLPHPALLLLLFVGGILMGFGARWMGGCTSGHGLCGTAIRSPGSYIATAVFFLTAVIVTYVIHFVTGGWI